LSPRRHPGRPVDGRQSLTQLTVERIKPPTGKAREEHYDKNLPGFALRVTKAGAKSWIVFYRVRGQAKNERYTIGSLADFPDVAKARDIAREIKQKAAKGEDPKAEQRSPPAAAGLTVDELIGEYLTRWARPKKRSADEDERMLRRELLGTDTEGNDIAGIDLAKTWRKRPITDIRRRDIVLLLDRIVDRGSPIMANRALAGVRRMFNFAIERGLIELTPCVKVKPPGIEMTRERNLTDEEIPALWNALERAPMEANIRRLLRFMLVTVQRKGEIIGLHKREIDRERAIWTIPADRVKNKRDHVVPLSPLALEIIDEKNEPKERRSEEEAGWIFPSSRTGLPYEVRSIDHAMRGLFEHRPPQKGHKRRSTNTKPPPALAGFVPATPHDLRRTGATKMRELGISKDDVKLVLNHKDRSVTGRHYDRYEGLREKRHALETWARKIETLLVPGGTNVIDLATANG
jgi:integrase